MTTGEPVSGSGTVSGVPGLPGGFAGRFESRLTDVDGVRLLQLDHLLPFLAPNAG